MRKPDVEVREVVCSETGKPMPKIPLWMADIKVKFVSDEARQKHPSPGGMADIEPLRRSIASGTEADGLKEAGVAADDEVGFEDADSETDKEEEEDDLEA